MNVFLKIKNKCCFLPLELKLLEEKLKFKIHMNLTNMKNKSYTRRQIMEGNKVTSESIDEYILKFPPEIQEILEKLRKVIKESAPDA